MNNELKCLKDFNTLESLMTCNGIEFHRKTVLTKKED